VLEEVCFIVSPIMFYPDLIFEYAHYSQEITQEETEMVPLPGCRIPVPQGFPPRAIPPRYSVRKLESSDTSGFRGSELFRGEQIEHQGLKILLLLLQY